MKTDARRCRGVGLGRLRAVSAPFHRRRRAAFTLIEILVVVVIIALLLAVLLPSLQGARRHSRRTVCLSNLHQLSVALYSYQAEYQGRVPRWKTYQEQLADGFALWVANADGINGHPTRLGMLYPKYIGRNENVYYCPDAGVNALIGGSRHSNQANSYYYPWVNWGTNRWAYGSYEYRPRYFFSAGQPVWVGASYDMAKTARRSIAADGFAGSWDSFGPYPVHTPIQGNPRMLYYNVAYMDGSARAVKDFLRTTHAGPEFGTRSGPASQRNPYTNNPRLGGTGPTMLPGEYTPLAPGPECGPLPEHAKSRELMLKTDHIDRGWTFFDGK